MTNLYHGPKVRCLTTKETLSTLETWRQTVIYGLRLNADFRPYLNEGARFGKKSKARPYRELNDDVKVEKVTVNEVEQELVTVVKSKEDKIVDVDLMLEQIANYATNIPRYDITRDSASVSEVWQKIRQYYNIQQAGSLLNDVWNVKREYEESPQALFGRMKQLYNDNLLTTDGLIHVDGAVSEDEEMSPTLHNTIILHWLQVLHPELRDLVTQRFITQLRDHTFAFIFPEISRSVDSLLDELSNTASASRTFPPYKSNQFRSHQSSPRYEKPSYQNTYNKPSFQNNSRKKPCDFCKLTGKKSYYTHSIDECLHIKKINSNASARHVEGEEMSDEANYEHYKEFYDVEDSVCQMQQLEHVIYRINIDASPVFTLEAGDETCDATLDTGATCNVLNEKKAHELKAIIRPTTQKVRMADGKTNLEVVGETELTLYRNKKPFHVSAVVCRHTDTEFLAGMPFMRANDVAIRPYSDEIILGGHEFIRYEPRRKPSNTVRRITIHSQLYQVILPGESAEFKVPGFSGDVAIEPRWDTCYNKKISNESMVWPKPQILPVTNGLISLNNTLNEPIIIRKLEHIFNVQPGEIIPSSQPDNLPDKSSLANSLPTIPRKSKYSSNVVLNPDGLLSKVDEDSFRQTLTTYDNVFNPVITVYNGKSGPCFVEVNLGANLPTQRKGRLPFYGRNNLEELQDKFDELVANGIMSRPQDIGITVENTNPSFLVKKQPPSTQKRLVTDFNSISKFCRPTPSLLPNVESTLRSIASWKFLIKTDMSSAYHQLPMKKESKRFCGVHTPYRGLLVYNRGVMGLPGVEVALEELTCLLLGELVKQGKVAKLADDLFIGGNSPEELRSNFQQVLQKFIENDIKLSSVKTIIAPKSVTILGWVWAGGQIEASPHRLSALSTCAKPETVTALRSYLGAYRFLSRVIKSHAHLLAPLEEAIKGKNSKDKIVWSDELSDSFQKAKEALMDAKTITIPRSSDHLSIVTDASLRPGAVGSTLFAIREGKPLLAGFYNSKLPEFQKRWLPCEVEGLAIALSLDHFSPLIIQSQHKPQVLTDSKACVQAIQKLGRGEFSASARLSSFLSSVSRYQADVLHISGSSNLTSDYASRHPLVCNSTNCSICKFVSDTMESVIQTVTVDDIINGKSRIPYTNRNTWIAVQDDCSDLRKVKEFKKQGTIPNKKSKNLRTVRRYLSAGTLLAHDDLLVHPLSSPLGPIIERIVVPNKVLHGLLTVLHLRLSHPTAYQLSKAFNRYFYAMNLEKAISEVSNGCHQCAAIKDVPRAMVEESTMSPPSTVGGQFAADIIKRCSQKIFLLRETVTSYTASDLVPDETKETIMEALIKNCNLMRPSPSTIITVRLDPAPAHQSLFNSLQFNNLLSQCNINLEIGRTLNKNKNPVIEKGIRELVRELLILNPTGGPVTSTQLSLATANLNCRYRNSGLSAHEMWTQRDQTTGEQLPINDQQIIIRQHKTRLTNHPHSQRSKAFGKPPRPKPTVKVGSLVYVYQDRNKTTARQRYMITSINQDMVKMRKFTTQLFGTKEYEAKLTEIFKVPSIESTMLPAWSEDTQSEDTDSREESLPHQLTASSSSDSTQSSTDEESTNNTESNDSSDSEHSNSPRRRHGNYSQDPDVTPPTDLAPATMQREKRNRKEPNRYGSWIS